MIASIAAVGAAAVLWVAGLRHFLRTALTIRRKLAWVALLAVVGSGVGVLLPKAELWDKFLLVMALLPLLAAADVFLFRSRRGVKYWIEACGFEVGTVFGCAAAARLAMDSAGLAPLVERGGS